LKNLNKIGLIIFIVIITSGFVNAQQNKITLSGTILCEDDAKGALSFVNIYNKNTKKGAVSDTDGKFSIKMGKNDTILFSTVQHVEQFYYIKENEFFHDKNIEISMTQDTIWLDVVSVMGFKEFEEFKQEVLQLKLPDNDIYLVLPVVDKYAKQNYSGEGVFEIKGPLTYLSNKILSIKKRRYKNRK
tara:strand:- start:6247 stop:6807 length:561 start_codon:yes stop_codon:yes gene_type:complete